MMTLKSTLFNSCIGLRKFAIQLCAIFFLIIFNDNILCAQLPRHIEKNYKLIWQDEFEGHTIDTSKWAYRATGSKRGNGVVSEDNCYLDNRGHLVIEATKKDGQYYIGQISTYKKFYWTYGYFECRAKTTSQIGTSCAFWLQSPTYGKVIGDAARSGTEIDIFEYRHHDGKELVHHTIHWDGYGNDHQQKGSHEKVEGFDNGFHTFGLEWTENKYTFYIDGKKTWSTRKAVSQAAQYIILSLEMNDWSGDPSNSNFPDKVLFDWVRVYGA